MTIQDLECEAAQPGLAALWRSVLPTMAEISRARRRLHAKAVFIVAVVAASYWAAVIADWGVH